MRCRVEVNFGNLIQRLDDHPFWPSYLMDAAAPPPNRVGLHLAIFAEPFLSLVLNGRKTVESRFSRNRCAPFGEVAEGDTILIKAVAGPVRGIALAEAAWFFDLALVPLNRLKDRFGATICADEDFWHARRAAAYATLIQLAETTTIDPLFCNKRDRRGWVPLRSRQSTLAF